MTPFSIENIGALGSRSRARRSQQQKGVQHDIRLADDEELAQRCEALRAAIQTLTPRERHIFTARHLSEAPPKLETLACQYGISGERIRQIELRAFQKVKSAMRKDLPEILGKSGMQQKPKQSTQDALGC